MRSRILTILAITLLVYLGAWLGRILGENYWLSFFIWLSMPIASVWVYDNVDLENQSRFFIIKSVHIVMLIFTMVAFANYTVIKEDLATRYIDGYKLTITHDCERFAQESPFGDLIGEAPDTCKVEDLDRVSSTSKTLLFLIKALLALLLIVVPAITVNGEELHKKLFHKN
jgi:hypothetical protein